MIKAIFRVDADHHYTAFQLTGHADSVDEGYDLVCAGVSSLTLACVNALTEVAHQAPTQTANSKDGGFLKITAIDAGRDSQVICQTLLNGLLDIQQQYGQYLQVKIKE